MKRAFSALLCCLLAAAFVFAAACSGGKTHTHSFAAEWKHDAQQHWHECTGDGCGERKDEAPHVFDGGVVTREPDVDVEGTITYTCEDCGYSRRESISAKRRVTFETGGGTAISPVTVEDGALVQRPADPVLEGHTFEGWYRDDKFTQKWDFASDAVTSSLTLYAKYKEIVSEYNVTFVSGYGEEDVVLSTADGYITYVPEREGYTFNGWWLSSGSVGGQYVLTEKFDTSQRVTAEGLVLVADWVQNATSSSQLPAPSVLLKDGEFIFEGPAGNCMVRVKLNGEVLKEESVNPTFRLDGFYQPGWYVLEFYLRGDGVETINSPAVTRYYPHKILTDAQAEGIDFDTNMLTWRAVENAERYDLYIDGALAAEGLLLPRFDMSAYQAGEHSVKVVAEAEGFISSECTRTVVKYRLSAPQFTAVPVGDMLAYRLTWQAVACADRYNIMVNGRQYAQTTGTEYLLASDGTAWADGGVITVSVVAYDSGAGYFISQNNKTVQLGMLCSLTADIVREDAGLITLPENLSDGAMVWGQSYTISVSPSPAYTFLGWKLGGERVSQSASYTFTCSGNAAFVAEWEYYTVTVVNDMPEAGTVTAYSDTAVAFGTEVTLTAKANSGYGFAGWYSGDKLVSDLAEYTFTMQRQSVTLTAGWERLPLTAHYIVNGEEVYSEACSAGSEISYAYDAGEGYAFDGWFADSALTERVTAISGEDFSGTDVYLYGVTYAGTAGVTFAAEGEGYKVTGYNGEATDVVLPAQYNGKPVTGVSGLANKNFTSLVIPASVTAIPKGLLRGNSHIVSLTIPFVGNKPVQATDNNQFTFGYIFGSSSFAGASKVSQSTVYFANQSPQTATYYIPDSLKSVTISAAGYLPYASFENCAGITEVKLAEGVTAGERIMRNTGWFNSLPDGPAVLDGKILCGYKGEGAADGKLVVPDVQYIAPAALSGCGWVTTLSVPFVGSSPSAEGEQALLGYIFGEKSYSGGKRTVMNYSAYGSEEFYLPSSLNALTVRGGNLAYGALGAISTITSLMLENVGSIGTSALRSLAITSLTVPNTVTYMAFNCFGGLSKLTELVIPFIGESADSAENNFLRYNFGFENNQGTTAITSANLKKITVTGNITAVPAWAFYYIASVTEIILPDSVHAYYRSAFEGCSSLETFTVTENVTQISSFAFRGCRNLETLTFEVSQGWRQDMTAYDVTDMKKVIADLTANAYACSYTRV